jgi:hypothetical protein
VSTDSCTIDTEDWQGADVCTVGDVGGGVFGSEIAASGTNGPGYAYNDLAAGDSSKEICGRITTWPASGVLYAYEDTSFTYVPAGDGATSFQYQLYVDYVAIGSPQTVTLASGGSATAPGATLSGTSTISAGAASGQIGATATGATLTGVSTIQAGAASGTAAGTAPGATLTGASTISAGAATGGGIVSATAPGATLIGASSMSGGLASNGAAPPYVSPSRSVIFEGYSTTVVFEGYATTARFQ